MARGVQNHAELIICISKERAEWVRRAKRVEREEGKEGKEKKKGKKRKQESSALHGGCRNLENVFYKHLAFNGHLFDGNHPFWCFKL